MNVFEFFLIQLLYLSYDEYKSIFSITNFNQQYVHYPFLFTKVRALATALLCITAL